MSANTGYTTQILDRFDSLTTARATRYAVAILATILVLFPLFWMLSTSLRTTEHLLDFPPSLIPAEPTLKPFVKALNQGQWTRWFLNTAIISLGSTLTVLSVATPAAYALSRRDIPAAKFIYVGFLSTMMVPGQILLVPLFVMFSNLGLVNSYIGLILVYTMFFTGFSIFLLYGFFRNLPGNLEDAARVANIPEWKIFVKVVLPQAKPAIATAAIFVFVFTWNEFLFALTFMQDSAMYTISIGLTSFQGNHGSVVYNQLMAVSTLATLPVLLLFAATQEKFIKGLTTDI